MEQIAENYQLQTIGQNTGDINLANGGSCQIIMPVGTVDVDSLLYFQYTYTFVVANMTNVQFCGRSEYIPNIQQCVAVLDGRTISQYNNCSVSQLCYYNYLHETKNDVAYITGLVQGNNQQCSIKKFQNLTRGENVAAAGEKSFIVTYPLRCFLPGCFGDSQQFLRINNQLQLNITFGAYSADAIEFGSYQIDKIFNTYTYVYPGLCTIANVGTTNNNVVTYETTATNRGTPKTLTCGINLKIYPNMNNYQDPFIFSVQQQYTSGISMNQNFSIGQSQVSEIQQIFIQNQKDTQYSCLDFDECDLKTLYITKNGYVLFQNINNSLDDTKNNEAIRKQFQKISCREQLTTNSVFSSFRQIYSNILIQHVINLTTQQAQGKANIYITYFLKEANPLAQIQEK